MSRTLSTPALQSLFAQETGEALLFLVTLDHSTWPAPVRLVNNQTDVVSGGETFSAFPLSISLPTEDPDQIPRCTIQVCSVDRQILAALRALSTAPSVAVAIVLGSTPSTIEAGPFTFQLADYTYDSVTITGTLAHEDVLSEPIPAGTFNPTDFPGLFS